MWYNVNWDALVQGLTPRWWRKVRFVLWMRILYSQVERLHNLVSEYRSGAIYDLTITGQTMSLENALNDRFDDISRGCYIENLNDLTQTYLYNKAEGQPLLYLYNKWQSTMAFLDGQFCAHLGSIWVCNTDNTNEVPSLSSSVWSYVRPVLYLINKGEALQSLDFIVWVRVLLLFDQVEMRALIDTYKLAGKRYTIMTY